MAIGGEESEPAPLIHTKLSPFWLFAGAKSDSERGSFTFSLLNFCQKGKTNLALEFFNSHARIHTAMFMRMVFRI